MAFSMTGFGKAQGTFSQIEASLEIRSVNNRFQEIFIKLPKNFQAYEFEARELIRKNIERGKISVFYQIVDKSENSSSIRLNENIIKSYAEAINKIKDLTGSKDSVSYKDILQFDDIFLKDDSEQLDESLIKFLNKLTSDALKELNNMRQREADSLLKDLKERNLRIKSILKDVIALNKESAKIELKRLTTRLYDLVESAKVNEDRLELELAIISDKVDVTEECIRLESHLNQFDEEVEKDQGIGKRLNFLLQEMNREVNTIGSKTNLIDISKLIMSAKEEIERIREQVQNLE